MGHLRAAVLSFLPALLCCLQSGQTLPCSFPFIFVADREESSVSAQSSAVIDTNRPLIVFNRQELLSLPSLPLGFQVISASCWVSGPCLLTIDATFSLSDHLILHNAGTLLAAQKIYC